jgi:hypothetical protein
MHIVDHAPSFLLPPYLRFIKMDPINQPPFQPHNTGLAYKLNGKLGYYVAGDGRLVLSIVRDTLSRLSLVLTSQANL